MDTQGKLGKDAPNAVCVSTQVREDAGQRRHVCSYGHQHAVATVVALENRGR